MSCIGQIRLVGKDEAQGEGVAFGPFEDHRDGMGRSIMRPDLLCRKPCIPSFPRTGGNPVLPPWRLGIPLDSRLRENDLRGGKAMYRSTGEGCLRSRPDPLVCLRIAITTDKIPINI